MFLLLLFKLCHVFFVEDAIQYINSRAKVLYGTKNDILAEKGRRVVIAYECIVGKCDLLAESLYAPSVR